MISRTPRLPGTMNNGRKSSTVLCANALREYLTALPTPIMDKPAGLAKKLGLPTSFNPDAWLVCAAFDALAKQGFLVMRHGTRSENRGHYAIRIVSTGKIIKTANCPFEPPT